MARFAISPKPLFLNRFHSTCRSCRQYTFGLHYTLIKMNYHENVHENVQKKNWTIELWAYFNAVFRALSQFIRFRMPNRNHHHRRQKRSWHRWAASTAINTRFCQTIKVPNKISAIKCWALPSLGLLALYTCVPCVVDDFECAIFVTNWYVVGWFGGSFGSVSVVVSVSANRSLMTKLYLHQIRIMNANTSDRMTLSPGHLKSTFRPPQKEDP